MSLHVLAPGLQTSVQDLGRDGHAAAGVARAGAMDAVALRLANALVGNVENAAGLEMTLRGPALRVDADILIAITGAEIDARCGGGPVPGWRPLLLRAGSELVFGNMRHGARSYLAVAGGIAVAAVLGSRATDLNAGLGPFGGRALTIGDVLPTLTLDKLSQRAPLLKQMRQTQSFAAVPWSLNPSAWFDSDPHTPIGAIAGQHFANLDDTAQSALFASEFRISATSNRVGCRLEGATLALRAPLELISEGVAPGTVQLPPGGTPIVLMAEAPTIGGYPRVAQVIAVDLSHLAQRAPGTGVRFMRVDLNDAQTRYLAREQALAQVIAGVAQRLRE